MKLLKSVEKIFKKKYHPFEMPDESFKNIYQYIEANPEEKAKYIHPKNDAYFNEKYKDYLEEGHYGLALEEKSVIKYLDDIFKDLINFLLFEVHKFIINSI